jgi:hypothetical protein
VAKVPGDWSSIKRRLESIFARDNDAIQADAVIALCTRWPESINNPKLNSWLQENSGYWWAERLLAGERIFGQPT